MKKKILYLLIACMSFSLIGIIWVQVYWIQNGITVKEAQFDQLVNNALNDVVSNIEDGESVQFITDQLAKAASEIVVAKNSKPTSKNIKNWVKTITKIDSSNSKGDSFNYEISTDSDEDGMELKINVNGDQKIINLSDISKLFDDAGEIFEAEEEIEIGKRFSNVITKMVKEFKDIDQPIQHILKAIDLNSIINSSLKNNGITTPFTYAVIHEDEIIEEFSSDDFTLSKNNFNIPLFKNNLFDNSAQLSIRFKGKKTYLLKSMGLMLVLSILFTLIILLTFASTVHYMIKQKKLSEMKNDFINNMTHEFKTPISTISLAIDSITHPKIINDKTQINHFADIIRKENLRMNKQVESVLNTAQGEKEELEFDKTKIDLTALIQLIPERMKLQLETHQADLKINHSTIPLFILGDEMHIQNAICNLIDNAIKYNTNTPKINIYTNSVNGFCEVQIIDNGIGMSNETQKKVFDKFYRVEKGNIHTIKGFGIGLSYVKAIVTAHKGSISLKSKLQKGTTITISIPTI
jgi:two-component system phosphate regulon sensor histidine kinase PhoR